ncbi:MAG: hypothetical protein JW779_04995 [Candidatus Thorarchaeota archaeon]|nr:hypothetical protein [Candidatus Thorarchaeota archaeon]
MMILLQESEVVFMFGYTTKPFIVLVIVVIYIYLRNRRRNQRLDAITEPFEEQSS